MMRDSPSRACLPTLTMNKADNRENNPYCSLTQYVTSQMPFSVRYSLQVVRGRATDKNDEWVEFCE